METTRGDKERLKEDRVCNSNLISSITCMHKCMSVSV